ncbi:MAG: tetratricopeptide repeat protein [Treponema sp.]|nr:tetratricopeptide repeat protein [Treponema sp.]
MKKIHQLFLIIIFSVGFFISVYADESVSLTGTEDENATNTTTEELSSEVLHNNEISKDGGLLNEADDKSFSHEKCLVSYQKGKSFFLSNQPQVAIPYFETAIKDPSINLAVYIYLGVSYYQTAQFEKALKINERGMRIKGSDSAILAFNGGNAAFSMGDYDRADVMYSLALTSNPVYSEAMLNRANSRMKQERYEKALEDYKQFLVLAPDDEQSPNVRILVSLLQEEIDRKLAERDSMISELEKLRAEVTRITEEKENLEKTVVNGNGMSGSAAGIAVEEAAKLRNELIKVTEEKDKLEQIVSDRAEEDRIAAEKEAEDDVIRQKLLQDIMNSLQKTESTNMSAGAEGTIDYDYESDID